jgi:uncharacterized protein YcnI
VRPRLRSILAAALTGLTAAVLVATPASAHTEVEVEPARAGATNALVTITAEAENDGAGIVSVQVFLPEGIAPADVRLVSGPSGWRMATDTDSYTVSGRALGVGTNARHRVRIRQLPTDPVIYFKVLVTYSDDRVDRWIELPSAANPTPDNPAPGVRLAGGVSRTPTPPPTSDPPATTVPPAGPATGPATGPVSEASPAGGGNGLLIGLVLAALVAAGIAAFVVIRRRRAA